MCTTPGDENAAGGVEVVLPGNRNLKGIRRNDLERCEHDCSGKIGVGYLLFAIV